MCADCPIRGFQHQLSSKIVSYCIALLIVCLMSVLLAEAQQEGSTKEVARQSPSTEQAEAKSPPSASNNDKRGTTDSHRAAFVGAPIPTASPAIGSGATLIAGYVFSLRANDTVSPPSVIGGAALFTNNGTRALVVGTELYFKEDRYHILTGFAHGDLNYDFYGTGNQAGNAGVKFGLNQKGTVFFGEVMQRVGGHVFVGPRFWLGSSSLAPQNFGQNHPDLPPLNVSLNMRALGFKVERDTTPNRFYPVQGTMLHLGADFFAKGIGSTFSFQTYRLTFNTYHSFGTKQLLAYNAFICLTGGQAPFFGKCIFGTQNELRGYPAGRYIDRKMIATQVEYRRVLPWRFGVVAFGGVGEVAPSLSKFNADNLLGSVGGGVRFSLSAKYHVNLRADIAQGKNGHTFSMGLGEAF
jgi:surface antigen Omp85-like protein